MAKPFTEEELERMKGKYASLGRKHCVSLNYIKQIAQGERPTNTLVAKKIYKDVEYIIDFFTPENEKIQPVTETE